MRVGRLHGPCCLHHHEGINNSRGNQRSSKCERDWTTDDRCEASCIVQQSEWSWRVHIANAPNSHKWKNWFVSELFEVLHTEDGVVNEVEAVHRVYLRQCKRSLRLWGGIWVLNRMCCSSPSGPPWGFLTKTLPACNRACWHLLI